VRGDARGSDRTASASGVALVRDTTDRDGGTLRFTTEAWVEFAASLK
jgi:Domain of unknown function (DUF397)